MAAGQRFRRARPRGGAQFRPCGRGGRRAPHRLPRRPDSRQPRSEHLRSRAETGEILRQSGVPVTELRAGMIIGPGSAAYEVIRDLVNHLPVMVTPRWVQSVSTPIALDDLLEYLVALPSLEAAAGRTFDAGGPEAVTYEQVMRCYGRLVGRDPTHRAGAGADAAAVVALAVAGDDRAGRYRAGAGRGSRARLRRARRRTAAPGAAHAPGPRSSRSASPSRPTGSTRSSPAGSRARSPVATSGRSTPSTPSARAPAASGPVDPARVFATVCTVGGEDGWFHANLLWWIRGAIDWLVGGPSFRRSRRHPTELRVGDVVDSWRVIALEPGRRLTLLMEMKAPGAGVLEFVVQPGRRRRQRLAPRPTGTRPGSGACCTGTRWCPRTCSSSRA